MKLRNCEILQLDPAPALKVRLIWPSLQDASLRWSVETRAESSSPFRVKSSRLNFGKLIWF